MQCSHQQSSFQTNIFHCCINSIFVIDTAGLYQKYLKLRMIHWTKTLKFPKKEFCRASQLVWSTLLNFLQRLDADSKSLVPKILHFMWIGSQVPEKYQENVIVGRNNNPAQRYSIQIANIYLLYICYCKQIYSRASYQLISKSMKNIKIYNCSTVLIIYL